MTKKVTKLAYHRNGVSGLGFWVGIVKEEKDRMLVVRFPKEADKETGGVVCAAFNIDLLNDNVIEFAQNSYRGDHFNEIMDEAIAKREAE